jgi:excisionase family DNA binding protein
MERMELLTVKEAAARSRVGTTVVYAWVASGVLPSYRVGLPGRRGKILIAGTDLEATVETFKVDHPPTVPANRKRGAAALALKHLSLD